MVRSAVAQTRAGVLAAALLAPLVLASGCGTNAVAGHTATPSGARTADVARTTAAAGGSPTGSSAAGCSSGKGRLCVTQADDGRTLRARVGWTVTLELRSPDLEYGRPQLTGSKVLALIGRVTQSSGATLASYRAVAAGDVHVRALARPRCARGRGRACPLYIAVWQVWIRVLR